MNYQNLKTMDPYILFSAVNMQLRNEYESLESLCAANEVNMQELVDKLKAAGFEYNKDNNQFK
ncbi:MAG: DUF4250 domain-containing protein [Aeromonadales bacterium]|nr:DUF4250 domain-containing protein [Aeromonadales bacterium]